ARPAACGVRDLALRRPRVLHRPARAARRGRARGRRRLLRAARGHRAILARPRADERARRGAGAASGDRMTRLRAAPVALLAFAASLSPARAAGEGADYDPHSTAWNGMASFVGLAEGMGFEVSAVSSLEWGDVSAEDILVLIYPLQRVDPGRVGAFVQAGGNLVLADDFGEGKDAMQGLGLLRAEVETPRASRYYDGRTFAPIATARGNHPLAVDVGEVVTNHPAALNHIVGATEVIGFDDGAVVVAGERGSGRFVAISDPSIFINKM